MSTGIQICYTAYCVNDWEDIMRRHMELIRDNILSSHDADISVFAYPRVGRLYSVVDVLGKPCAVHWSDVNDYEFPALRSITADPRDVNLYMHTKGVSHTDPARKEAVRRWDRYMCRFNVQMCDLCLSQLSSSDCCGVSFRTCPFWHYSGNFWWSNGAHLARLRDCRFLVSPSSRFDAERLIGASPAVFTELCGVDGCLYDKDYDPDSVDPAIRVFVWPHGLITSDTPRQGDNQP